MKQLRVEGHKYSWIPKVLASAFVGVSNVELVEDILGRFHSPFDAPTTSIDVHKTPSTCYNYFVQIFVIKYHIRAYKKSFPGMANYFPLLSFNKMERFKIKFEHISNDGFEKLISSVSMGGLRNRYSESGIHIGLFLLLLLCHSRVFLGATGSERFLLNFNP